MACTSTRQQRECRTVLRDVAPLRAFDAVRHDACPSLFRGRLGAYAGPGTTGARPICEQNRNQQIFWLEPISKTPVWRRDREHRASRPLLGSDLGDRHRRGPESV